MNQYDTETALTRRSDDVWEGRVSAAWNIGDNPNGGYLIAIVQRALAELAPQHPDPLTLTVHYLRPGAPDTPCEVHGELLRTGRTLSTLRGTLLQEGKTRLEVLAGYGDLGSAPAAPGLTLTAPEIPAPEQCVRRSGDEQGVVLPLLDRVDVLLHPDQAKAGSAGRAEVSGWIRFVDGRNADAAALVLFADAFPPSVFGLLGLVGWVPTLELTVHVRRRPVGGWILGRFATTDLADGRMVEDGALWDSQGNLVAQSRQIALVIPGE